MIIENKSLSHNAQSSEQINHQRMIEMKSQNMPSHTANIFDAALASYIRTGNINNIEYKGLDYNPVVGGMRLGQLKIFDSLSSGYSMLDLVTKLAVHSSVLMMHAQNGGQTTSSARWSDPGTDLDRDTFGTKLTEKRVVLGLCVAVCDVSRSMLEELDDQSLMNWLIQRISADFALTINQAIISGDGNNKPLGILADPDVHAKQEVNIDKDDVLPGLLDMMSQLDARYMNQACWIMSQTAFTKLIKNGLDKKHCTLDYLAESTSDQGASYRLLGKPVYITKDLEQAGASASSGSSASGSTVDCNILLADLKSGYTIIHNPDVRFMHQIGEAFVEKVRFAYRMRVGGLVTDSNAFIKGVI